jgi:hypothetical protein
MCAEIRTGELLAEIKSGARVARAAGTVAKMNRNRGFAVAILQINLPHARSGQVIFCRLRDPGMLGHYKGVGGDAYLAAERPVERYDHRYQKRERGCDDAGHRQVHAEG